MRLLSAVLLVALVGLAIAWLAGTFQDKVADDGNAFALAQPREIGDADLVEVRLIRVPRVEQAVGSVRAVHETGVASRVLASVLEVKARPGDRVQEGDVLALLDDEALRARARQSEAELDAARALHERAQTELGRVRSLVEQGAESVSSLDDADTAVRTAAAAVERAQRGLDEAQTALRYATIRAPMAGVVIERKVEPGDTVVPGQTLLTLYDPDHMQLVAGVRESVAMGLTVGDAIPVRIDALDLDCLGTISEIVPRSAEASRTLDVKVTGPCPPGVYSGMFGRLLLPLGDEDVLVLDANVVREVGQLRLVDVAEDGLLRRRAVRLGRRFAGHVEVLAGLRAGERVAVPE